MSHRTRLIFTNLKSSEETEDLIFNKSPFGSSRGTAWRFCFVLFFKIFDNVQILDSIQTPGPLIQETDKVSQRMVHLEEKSQGV